MKSFKISVKKEGNYLISRFLKWTELRTEHHSKLVFSETADGKLNIQREAINYKLVNGCFEEGLQPVGDKVA